MTRSGISEIDKKFHVISNSVSLECNSQGGVVNLEF